MGLEEADAEPCNPANEAFNTTKGQSEKSCHANRAEKLAQ